MRTRSMTFSICDTTLLIYYQHFFFSHYHLFLPVHTSTTWLFEIVTHLFHVTTSVWGLLIVLFTDSFLWILCFTKLQTSFWLLRQFVFFSFLLMANKYRHEHIYYHQIAITARRIQFSTTTLLVLLMFFNYCALYTYSPWL